MKKRLLSALLALALVFVLLPTTALAETPTQNADIYIAGTGWNFEKDGSTYKTVYYQIQSSQGVGVFLNEFGNEFGKVWTTNPYLEITRVGNDVTITVHGDMKISSNDSCIESAKSYSGDINLIITGTRNDTLTLTNSSIGDAIYSHNGDVTIKGGITVNAYSTCTNPGINNARGIYVHNHNLTISGANTKVNVESMAAYSTVKVDGGNITISDGATLTAKNTSGDKAISFDSITADGYDFMGRSGNSGPYTTLTGDDKATKLQEYSSIQITPTPTPTLEKSDVSVAGTKLYKNTAYTIQEGKPVMGGTYPDNYNIYLDATNYVLHVKNATIEATYTGIYGVSNIVFEGTNSITAGQYGIYSYFKSSDLKISGTGSLEVKTIAGDPAIATAYDTSRSIIISGNDFTVTADTSGTTSYAIKSDKDLTITGGAAVTAKSNATRAIDITGNLTVNSGATLTATSTSTKPTVQVGGNASFTGSTVTITNNSTEPHKDAADTTKGDSVSSALYVKGNINITDNANVTAKVENGGGNAIGALGNITVNGSTVTAANRGQKFTTIIAKNVYVSGDSKITANNLNKNSLYNGLYLACPAIEGNIVNKNTDYSLNFKGEHSSSSEPKTTLAPGEQTTLYYYNVTITCGDAYVAPTNTITEIIVTGLTPPVKGATPVDKSKVTLTEGLTVESITWGPDLTSDGKFAADTSYTAHIKYSVNAGYELAANANCPQVAGANVTRWHQEGMPQDEIEVTFPKTGGGSTHEHNWDEAWHDTGDYHHAHQCTICKAYDTTTQELHNVTGHRDNHDGSHSNICGSCGYSAKVSHSYTWAPNANDNEKHIGTCVCGNVVEKNHNFVGDVCSDCGYDKSTGTTCEHVWTTEWTIDTVDNEYHWHKCIKCNAITDKKPHAYTIVTDSGTNHIRECECKVFYVEDHISSDWIIDAPATPTTAGSMHKECTVCKHKMQTEVIPATGEIVPPTPDNPGTIVIIRPAEEEKPAQQPNPSTGANDLVGLAVAAAVAAALGSAALLRKHD